MATPIRTITFAAGAAGVTPDQPQFAGVQGEHNATRVVFSLDNVLVKPEYKYRFEYVDVTGQFDTTEFVEVADNQTGCLLPENWTRMGGTGEIRLSAVVLAEDGTEEQLVYTLSGHLKYASRDSGTPMEGGYRQGLSSLIQRAENAADAAGQAAQSANQAAAEAIEISQTAADAAAKLAQAAADDAMNIANAAAGNANTAAEAASQAAFDAVEKAGEAKAAADRAELAADTVQEKLNNGEFTGSQGPQGNPGPQGPKGDKGDQGPMGELSKAEADNRYSNVLTGKASGGVAYMEDVSPLGTLRRAAVLGVTTETGAGDKAPDNPYTLSGAEPTKVTVCGKNLIPYPYIEKTKTENGITFTDNGDGTITLDGTPTAYAEFSLNSLYCTGIFTLSGIPNAANATFSVSFSDKEGGIVGTITGKTVSFNTDDYPGYRRMSIKVKRLDDNKAIDNVLIQPQLELDSSPTAYTPYTEIPTTLPALAPLYSLPDGTADEYDAMTGVETRRIGVKVFDGTENWELISQSGDYIRFWITNLGCAGNTFRKGILSDRFETNNLNTQNCVFLSGNDSNGLINFYVGTDVIGGASLELWKGYLAAQHAAGAPVTVLYKLAAPVITRHDTAAIQPLTPVCNVFADAGTMDVGYNRDINLAFQQLQNAIIAQGGMINV